ncbi:MAG: MBL fold metallo-hydrolase [Candidatus Rokubacteria bacterium]|nr:MBL fold metallo-hydrolase [Candidatus Rokubacteria bacterium]
MKVTLWGTRGSLASPGPDTARYGGNTSCVAVLGPAGTVLILDAGTGIRRLGTTLPRPLRRVDLLLTHLHMDHIQGLGFFAPLYEPETEIHIWGPASPTLDLRTRLTRYLSPPLFPVRLRDVPASLLLHEVASTGFEVGEFRITADLVCHPGPTVGYRIEASGAALAYLPDHEPALGARKFPAGRDWTSGCALAAGADLLLHDAQYSRDEYSDRIGWGHSSPQQALEFAALAGVAHLVPFHHDPAHSDEDLDRMLGEAVTAAKPAFRVTAGTEGASFELGR